jgi:hypothetical protein
MAYFVNHHCASVGHNLTRTCMADWSLTGGVALYVLVTFVGKQFANPACENL